MTGTTHILVAAKPVQGNYVENAMSRGVCGLWIDGTRLPVFGERLSCSKAAPYADERTWITAKTPGMEREQHPLGRWPANVILGHSPECIMKGLKKVKGSPTSKSFHDGYDGESVTGFVRGVSHPGNQHAGEDGTETVQDWECVRSCAVRRLDENSGLLVSGKPGVRRKPHETNAMAGRLAITGNKETGFGDSGGASRFFKQVGEFSEEAGRTADD